MLDRVLVSVHQFRHEHKIFKGAFLFKGQDYQVYCERKLSSIS
jgi:hypothetical protein